MSMVKEWQHLEIPLKEIEVATENFKTFIGRGGYGSVFKGKLLVSGKETMVAVKRLNEQFGQGLKEFLTEIQLLSGQQHPNLISLVGYCDVGREKSIVYQYAERGSLDQYIRRTRKTTSTTLTWLQRLKICADAARGLNHLHSHVGGHRTIIHRDIKSSNILIDENWVGKISDLGLSKLSVTGFGMSVIVSNGCGTQGYCDPEYHTTGIVTKKSDVYSFGVVLFEVLCGRLCLIESDDGFLLSSKSAKYHYNNNSLDKIMDDSLREHIGSYSMTKFAAIAYKCLNDDREQRPAMDVVAKELEEALKYQEEYEFEKEKRLKSSVVLEDDTDEYWETKLPGHLDSLIKMFKIPNAFFWISDEGEKCLLVSSSSFISSKNDKCLTWASHDDSRFKVVAHYSQKLHNVKLRIKTSMLSLGTMYEASLVFKNPWAEPTTLIKIKWKTNDLIVCSTHVAQRQIDNWSRIKMWHFWNHVPNAEFDIVIDEFSYAEGHPWDKFWIQGIEFQSVEMASISFLNKYEREGFISPLDDDNDDDDDDMDDDEYWEKKLPENYQRYIEISDKPLNYATKKELYLLFCGGFLADNGQLWFSMFKSTHGICSLLLANKISSYAYRTISLSESRFEAILESLMFSPQYTYACYLLFIYEDNASMPDNTVLLKAECKLDGVSTGPMFGYWSTFPLNIPTIKPKNDQGLYDLSNIPRVEGFAMKKDRTEHLGYTRIKERKDGWMEVMLFKPTNQLLDHSRLQIDLWGLKDGAFKGMIIEGIEFRPYI